MRRNLRSSAYKLTLIASMMLVLVLCAGVSFAQTEWSQWNYHVDVDVNTGQYARTATPVELQINFTNYLPAGKTFDVNSVRVAEFADSGRNGAPVEVVSQFDTATGFDAATNASGEVVWILRGDYSHPNVTLDASLNPAGTKRFYRVYFDDTNNTKSAPGYTGNAVLEVSPDAEWTTSGSTPHIQSIGNYAVWYGFDTGHLFQMDNRRTATTNNMIASLATGNDWAAGLFYIETYDTGKGTSSCNGTKNALTISANRAVRATVTVKKTATDGSAVRVYDIVRKFYAGVPYFKDEVKLSRSDSSTRDFYLEAGVRYNWSSNAPYRPYVGIGQTPDPVTGGNTAYSAIIDYDGTKAGMAILGSADYMPSRLGEATNGTNGLRDMHKSSTENRYWRNMGSPNYPVTITHGVALHTGMTEADAITSTTECMEDYGCPVSIMVAGTGSISGKVVDTLDNTKPVRGAMVRLWVNNTLIGKTYASVLGDFTFSNVPAGVAKISVKCDEYETKTVDLGTVTAGNLTNGSVDLQPIIVAGAAVPNWMWLTTGWKIALDTLISGAVTDGTDATFTKLYPDYDDSSLPSIDVPGTSTTTSDWDDLQSADNVYGIYRNTVNLPDSWAGKNLRLRNYIVDDVAAVYFNGEYIGQLGTFPNRTNIRDTSAANGYLGSRYGYPNDFIIPGRWVHAGNNVLAIKVFDGGGGGGIAGTAPLLEVAPSMAAVTVNVTGPHDYGNTPSPIEGATVKIVGAASGTTDENGNCTFGTIPGDNYTITVTHPNYGTKTLTNVEIPESGSITIPVEYNILNPVVTVNVSGPQTYNGPKLPIEGANVSFGGSLGTTDANGNCTYDKTIAPGFYTVTVNHPNYGTKTLTNVEVTATPSVTVPVEYDTFFCKVTGAVTKNNAPLANARVVITNGDTYGTAITDANGAYTITGVKAGDALLSANALKAAPVVDKPVQVYAMQVALDNVDLVYGITPTYDDFSGTALDESKWGFYNISLTDPLSGNPSTATVANGILTLGPEPTRGGILGKTAVNTGCGTYEVRLANKVVADSYGNQGFAIIDPTYPGGDIYGHGVCLEQQRWFAKVFFKGNGIGQVPVDTSSGGPGYPVVFSILKTGDHYDFYVNGKWSSYLGKMPADPNTGKAYLTNNAQIYLNGYERTSPTNGLQTACYFDEVKAGASVPVTPTTLAGARAAGDGTLLSVSGAVVTASYDNYFFVENTDRSAGIKVISTSKPAVGKVAFIPGYVNTVDNEVTMTPIRNADMVFTDDSNKTVPPPVAITGKVAGELDKVGAAAQGMIVKVAGTVTGLHTNTDNNVDGYFLDDGSGIVGDGTHKGIFIEMDPTWGTNSSVVGKFKTIVSPLTVKKLENGTVLPAVKGEMETIPTFTAYNDCCWSDGQTSGNITTYSVGTGSTGASTGFLKDYVTGVSFPVTATFTPSGDVACVTGGGANCIDGSDAANIFGGKVDFTGYIKCNTDTAYVELTFSGLDPNGSYEFTTTANAGSGLMTPMRYTISGALSFTNGSSAGTGYDVVISSDGTYTEFDTGSNTGYGMLGSPVTGGYVAKWTGIKPSAAGTFTIKASLGDNNSNLSGAVFSGFMLKKAQ
ncbi:MAG: carboxypeptidase regulatory-like domain-containing protein [Armatimonadota bacterium]